MRILYFSPHPTHDIVSDVGYSTHQREMIEALRQLGHEVFPIIIGGATQEDLPRATTSQSPSVFTRILKKFFPPLLWRTAKDWRLMRHDRLVAGPRLEEAIKEIQPDLIYERSEYCLKQGSVIASKYNIQHIYEVNAPCVEEWLEFEGNSLLTRRAEEIERIKMSTSHGFCPVSTPLKDFLINEYGVEEEKVRVIPNAINLANIPNGNYREVCRKSLGYNEENIVIGFIGAILPYHGVDSLLKAFAQAKRGNDALRLLIIGDGDLLNILKNDAQTMGVEDEVSFTGRVKHDKVWEYMSAMDICVNPKHSWYGSPIKTFEYGVMGKAILAPDQGNMRDVLRHGETGYLYDGTENDLQKALVTLANEPVQRQNLGNAIEKQIKSEHTWVENAKRLVSFSSTLGNQSN